MLKVNSCLHAATTFYPCSVSRRRYRLRVFTFSLNVPRSHSRDVLAAAPSTEHPGFHTSSIIEGGLYFFVGTSDKG